MVSKAPRLLLSITQGAGPIEKHDILCCACRASPNVNLTAKKHTGAIDEQEKANLNATQFEDQDSTSHGNIEDIEPLEINMSSGNVDIPGELRANAGL